MKIETVSTFSDLDSLTEKFSRSSIFRGVDNADYTLQPSLFRHPTATKSESIDILERNLMWLFKTSARGILQLKPLSDLEWLVVAQHHGLPTRLLDWSINPLVACFFAVQSLSDNDGAIYITDWGRFTKEESIDMNSLQEITAFFPSHAARRVTAQSGMFTVHPTGTNTLVDDTITKLVIPQSKKKSLLEKLVKFGVHHATMFPDLDGLSKHLKYLNNY